MEIIPLHIELRKVFGFVCMCNREEKALPQDQDRVYGFNILYFLSRLQHCTEGRKHSELVSSDMFRLK